MRKLLLIITWALLLGQTAFADEYYIGRWEWCVDEEHEYWCAPQREFLTGVIDLRSLPQQSQAGGTPQGWALFSYSQPVSDSRLFNLSNALDRKLNNPVIAKIEAELGIDIQATTVREAIWEILTVHGDPTGQSKWKPLMPGMDLKREIHFGTEGKIKEQAFKMFESKGWELVLGTVQEDYRRLVKEEEHDRIARWLDFNEEKYGIFYGYFIPDGEVIVASLPHETTITDSFTGTDGASPPDSDLTWTNINGGYEIETNQVEVKDVDVTTFCRAEHDLSSDDHYAEAVVVSKPTYNGAQFHSMGVAARFSASASTLYTAAITGTSGPSGTMYKHVNGTQTILDSGLTAPANGSVFTIEASGSTIRYLDDDVELSSVTDTAITGNLRTGLGRGFRNGNVYNNQGLMDNFEAADLAVADTGTKTILRGITARGVTIR